MSAALLKPKFGRRVRAQNGELIPAAGDTLEPTPHIRRLIADGDLVSAQPPKPKAKTKPKRRSQAKKGTDQ